MVGRGSFEAFMVFLALSGSYFGNSVLLALQPLNSKDIGCIQQEQWPDSCGFCSNVTATPSWIHAEVIVGSQKS